MMHLGTLTVLGNSPPKFSSIVGNALQDATVQQGLIVIYSLPTMTDPDGDVITVTIMDGGSFAYPTFVSFTDPSNTAIKLSPSLSTAVGTYPISVQLTDGIVTKAYTLNILVTAAPIIAEKQFTLTNQGPPIFTAQLETIFLKIGKEVTYTLPTQTDPDLKDQISVAVMLNQIIS